MENTLKRKSCDDADAAAGTAAGTRVDDADSLVLSSSKGTPKRGTPQLARLDNLQSLQRELYAQARAFFDETKLREDVIPFIQGRSQVSLRVIDWLVTNYAKEFPERCEYMMPHHRFPFQMHDQYRYQLKLKHKGGFDPFGRGERILFRVGTDEQGRTVKLLTTIGQLSFFQWAITEGVLAYARAHVKEIEKHMNERCAARTRGTSQKKRRELSHAQKRQTTSFETDFVLKI